MKSNHESQVIDRHDCRKSRTRASLLVGTLCAMVLAVGLAGCSLLKPVKSTAHYYVLTPIAAAQTDAGSLVLGLGPIKLPAYLFNTSLAVRKGTNEIEYLDAAIWAERLEAGFQRVLAADLATVLPARQIRMSAWQSDAVAAEIYITVDQFEVDASGRGSLSAQWRIVSPGGEKVLKVSRCHLLRDGPPPADGVSGAIATLSELVAELSRQLAQELKTMQ